jgi:hypothetical protein
VAGLASSGADGTRKSRRSEFATFFGVRSWGADMSGEAVTGENMPVESDAAAQTAEQPAAAADGTQANDPSGHAHISGQAAARSEDGEEKEQPTPSPRRRMPSGLSASISPGSISAKLSGGATLDAPIDISLASGNPFPATGGGDDPHPGPQGSGGASPAALGGGGGRAAADGQAASAVPNVLLPQSQFSGQVRDQNFLPAQMQQHAQASAPLGAAATHSSAAPAAVAAAAPDLARMAGVHQSSAMARPNMFPGQPAMQGMTLEADLRPPAGEGSLTSIDPHQTHLIQFVGERVNSPADARALHAIMVARHGDVGAPTGEKAGASVAGSVSSFANRSAAAAAARLHPPHACLPVPAGKLPLSVCCAQWLLRTAPH